MVVISIFADNNLSEREYVLNDNSQFTTAQEILNQKFQAAGPDSITVQLTFGIDGYDPEFWGELYKEDPYDTTKVGGPIFDINFEIYSVQS